MTISSRLMVASLALICSFTLPLTASATSASISVSGNEGAITVSAQASFSTHIFCSGSGDNKKCWPVSTGSLAVYRNNSLLGSEFGDGSSNWYKVLNAGALSQGQHIFKATARDSKGNTDTATKTITIDNTPVLTVTAGDPEGDMNAHGTVDFKESSTGNEGTVYLYLDGRLKGSKSYEGANLINWTWKEITGHYLNAGTLSKGAHKIRILARAANGTDTNKDHEFTVDNAPDVTVSATAAEGDMNAQGTVDFKDNITGAEGTVYLYLDGRLKGSKSYEGADLINWIWEEITGHNLNAGTLSQGVHKIRVLARAANGTDTNKYHEFTVDNAPVVTVSTTDVEGDINAQGTVDFKDNITGAEGTVYLYLDGRLKGSKSYEGADLINWTWKEITGHYLNAGALSKGVHEIFVLARAANGTDTKKYHEFTVDNAPDVTVSATAAEGDMNAQGTVDFKDNITGAEGTVYLYLDGRLKGSKSYEGADLFNWTWEEITGHYLNAGTLSQGVHEIHVLARAANGTDAKKYHEFTIDNAPVVKVSTTDAEGDINAQGTVDFKDNITGAEGAVYLYLDGRLKGSKSYEGADLFNWTWEEITGHYLNAGTLSQGVHEIRILARAANGTDTNEYHEIVIDNTPETKILGSKYHPDDTFDILGTTTFKENITGNEGTITLYVKEISAASYSKHGATKTYEGKKISWKYSYFTGARMQKSVWGQKEILVKAVATAANGASTSVVKGMVIPALGCPTTFGN